MPPTHVVRYQAPEPIGEITLVSDGESLTALRMSGQRFVDGPMNPVSEGTSEDASPVPVLRSAAIWLDRYFAGEPMVPCDLPLAPAGSEFRRRVWAVLAQIPWGETVTYGDIAHRLEEDGGHRVAAVAVGGAVGHNPIPIILPCHRVVGASGSLTGYGCGMPRKVWLLEHEGVDMDAVGLFVPTRGTAL